jgi:EAL domain-containing protein (putative c-di-GMP-specific phosphodiesterase class I)
VTRRVLWSREMAAAGAAADLSNLVHGLATVDENDLRWTSVPGPAAPARDAVTAPGAAARAMPAPTGLEVVAGRPTTPTRSRRPVRGRPLVDGRSEQSIIDDIIDQRDIDIVFHAVLDALGDQIVGFEALLRGPKGPLQSPQHLLAAARACGRAGELDWIARARAFQMMLDSDLPSSTSLFVNVDPDSLLEPCPEDLLHIVWSAQSRLRVFVEITETMLLRQPVLVLESVRRARTAGWGIALDNVGYGATGLSLLPVIAPDVIKIDRQLLAESTEHASAAIAAASRQHCRTGASLLVERFERDETVPLAQALGVGFRQGRALAVEGPLPKKLLTPRRPVPLLTHPTADGTSPWQILTAAGATSCETSGKTGVSTLVRHLLSDVFGGAQAPMIGLALPPGHLQDPQSASVYRMLLERSPLQILLAPDAAVRSDWRTRGVNLPPFHPWSKMLMLVAISNTTGLVLAARPVHEGSSDGRFEVLLSHDLDVALEVLAELLAMGDAREPSGVHSAG